MEPVPSRQSRGDGLRALVELASRDVAGTTERFLLPDGAREAAVVVGAGPARPDRPSELADAVLATVAVVLGVYACVIAGLAAGPGAAAGTAALVAVSWAAARTLLHVLVVPAPGGRARGHCVALSREDSKRIARGAACSFADVLRAGDGDAAAAFAGYHQTLVSLARFELAAEQALRADHELARLRPDDPLRPVAGEMAQDKAAHAVAHRATARAAADDLRAAARGRHR